MRRKVKKSSVIITNKTEDLKIGFWDNQLCERGTTVSLYDYAYYNQKILNNKSYIFFDIKNKNNNQKIIEKFQKNFTVHGVDNFRKVDSIIKEENIDILYVIKSGENDGKVSKVCKTVIHCVFNAKHKHGNIYSSIHHSVFGNDGKYPVVPHMINLPSHQENMRKELNIPIESKVFGGYGGKENFDIPFVQNTVYQIAKENPNIYFIFANFNKFCPSLPNILMLDPVYDLNEKVKFINTCDAMLWGRQMGETFGLAIGEFSSKNKPIIATKHVKDKGHIHILKDKAMWYTNEKDLREILLSFDPEVESKKDWNAYRDYTPEKIMNIFKGVFIGGNIDISIGYLSWGKHNTLKKTLESHEKNSLFKIIHPENRTIFFQNISEVDKNIASKYNLNIKGSNTNIGILEAFIILVENCKTKYFIFCENDFILLDKDYDIFKTMEDAVKILNNDKYAQVKMSNYKNPGFLYCSDNKNSLTKENNKNYVYKAESLSWIKEPENFYQNLKTINHNYKWFVFNSEDQCWSNHIHMCNTSYLKEIIVPLLKHNRDYNKNLDIRYQGLEDTLNKLNKIPKNEYIDKLIVSHKKRKIYTGGGNFYHNK